MRGWRLWPILLSWLALAGPLRAEQVNLRELGPAEGLESLAIHATVQDADGFLWVGTENGLYRFDGTRFKRIGADQGLVWINALASQDGGLWIGTDEGLWRWQRGQLERVPGQDGQPLKIYGPGSLAPAADRSLWVGAKSGLHHLSRRPGAAGWRAVLAVPIREAQPALPWSGGVVALRDGAVWFDCAKALCRLRGGDVERFGPERGVPVSPWDWLLQAQDGSLWARGGAYVLQLQPGDDRFVRRDDGRLKADEAGFYPLAEDRQHRILTGTRGALLRWNGRSWERFDATSGLGFAGRLWALVADHEGGLWMAAPGDGLMQWRGYGEFENWSARDGLPDDGAYRFLRAGPGDDAPLYVGTGKGVAVLDPQARRFRPLASDASGAVDIGALVTDARGRLWAGTWGGEVVRYAEAPAGRGRVHTVIDRSDTVYGLLPDAPEGPLIVGLRQLYPWQPEHPGQAAKPFGEAIFAKGGFGSTCRAPDGGLWLGSTEGLLTPRDGRWQRLDAGGPVYRLACLRDGGWLVSEGSDGLRRLRRDGDALQRTDVTPPLLRGRQVTALLEDRRGWWWVSTGAGVAVFNGHHWRWLDRDAGLIWSDTSTDGLYEDADGSIWIGTSRGASRLRPPPALFEPVRGQVLLEEMRSGDSRWALAADGARVALPWSHDVIEVSLAAPVHRLRHAVRLEYRLAGFDERWMAAPADGVRLTGLPPGSYRFEARLVDWELGVASPASGFDLDIEPPWWRTGPAYAVAGVALLALGWLVHRWRTYRITRHAATLEALVQQRTQELEASRQQLLELATRDALTGAWNRRAIMEILERELGRAHRERLPLTLLVADIDHFKQINDGFGHPAGDAVLCEFVRRLTDTVRPYDAVGRFGGEEFLVVMPGLDGARPGDMQRVEALRAVVSAEPMPQAGRVTCSFGAVTVVPGTAVDAAGLVALADEALYRAKRNGRDQVAWA